MKAILNSFLLTLLATVSFAQLEQEQSEHLKFKGVPIDGTLDDYVSGLEESGFTPITKENGTAVLMGDFAGYKDCFLGVSTLKQKDLVSQITVIFPEQDTWSELSSNYFSLKGALTEKYGKPEEVVEKFNGNLGLDDDTFRMNQVKLDNCKYYTTYELKEGTIQLTIDHEGVTSTFVRLTYYDRINGEIVRAEAIDDL